MITYIGSPNFTEGREDKQIKKIIAHWIVGKLSVADSVFQDTKRQTSAHFGVGGNQIHQYVDIEDTAYHAGKWSVNTESIGIEHEGGPDLPISDATYKTSAKLIASLCLLYGIPIDKDHIIPHRQIVPTQCPGSLDIDRLISEANSVIIAQSIALTLQTIIPKSLLAGEDQDLEIQQIAGLLKDGKRDNADLYNTRKELEEVKRLLKEAEETITSKNKLIQQQSEDLIALKASIAPKTDDTDLDTQLAPIVSKLLGWLRSKLGL